YGSPASALVEWLLENEGSFLLTCYLLRWPALIGYIVVVRVQLHSISISLIHKKYQLFTRSYSYMIIKLIPHLNGRNLNLMLTGKNCKEEPQRPFPSFLAETNNPAFFL
ncbi:hypothetical protein PanWU01x14_345450, partial [Parasponia andersonii]